MRKWVIYVLVDPRRPEVVRYVGKRKLSAETRANMSAGQLRRNAHRRGEGIV